MRLIGVAGHKLFRVNYEHLYDRAKLLYQNFTKLIVHHSEMDVIALVNSWSKCRVTSIELIEDDISMLIPEEFIGATQAVSEKEK